MDSHRIDGNGDGDSSVLSSRERHPQRQHRRDGDENGDSSIGDDGSGEGHPRDGHCNLPPCVSVPNRVETGMPVADENEYVDASTSPSNSPVTKSVESAHYSSMPPLLSNGRTNGSGSNQMAVSCLVSDISTDMIQIAIRLYLRHLFWTRKKSGAAIAHPTRSLFPSYNRAGSLLQYQSVTRHTRRRPRQASLESAIFDNSSRLSHEPPIIARGLRNNGQLCFSNSTLQALSSLRPLIAFLEHISIQKKRQRLLNSCCFDWKEGEERDNVDCESVSVCEMLLHVLKGIGGTSCTDVEVGSLEPIVPCDPMDADFVLFRVGKTNDQFKSSTPGKSTMEQQDAQEFLQALMALIVTELESVGEIRVLPAGCNSKEDCDGDGGESVMSGIRSCAPLETGDSSSCGSEDEVLSLASLLHRIDGEQKRLQTNDLQSSSSPQSCSILDTRKEEKKMEEDDFIDHQDQLHFRSSDDITNTTKEHIDDWHHTDTTGHHHYQQTASMRMLTSISSTTPSPLSGWLGSRLQCASCHHVRPIQNAPFLDIPIVPTSISSLSPSPSCTLQQCLFNFSALETVEDVECASCAIRLEIEKVEQEASILEDAVSRIRKRNKTANVMDLERDLDECWFRLSYLLNLDPDGEEEEEQITDTDILYPSCSSWSTNPQKVKGRAYKSLRLTRPPSILCLHVQRRYYDPNRNRMVKTNQHVEFTEIMDISKSCCLDNTHDSSKRMQILYKLMSVVEHQGNAFGGHYQTYRRIATTDNKDANNEGGNRKEWSLISDESVKFLKWEDVRRCQAYMLFYEAM